MKSIFALIALCFSTSSFSQNVVNIGDWTVNKSMEGIRIASTATGEGSVVGILCNEASGNCFAYVIFNNIACEIRATYSLMINSAVGAYPVTTACSQIEGSDLKNLQVFNEFERVKMALESGGDVGFVMPLASGQFRVIRFSTKGATAAIKSAMALPSKPTPSNKPSSRETTL